MFARVSTFKGTPEGVDASVRHAREQILPAAREIRGFQGLISLSDRATGETIAITLWEGEDAMRASEDAANRLREDSASASNEEIVSVNRYEVTMFEPPR